MPPRVMTTTNSIMTEAKETTKVTRAMLRGIAPGETLKVLLPDAKACYAGKATAYQFQNIEGCKFKVRTFIAERMVEITRVESPAQV